MPGVAVSGLAAAMRLTRLRLTRFRGFEAAEWQPGPGFNLVLGHNGAGKTSLLEAIHLLGHGRSFRGRVRDGLVRHGSPALEVYAEWLDGQQRAHRAGLRHSGSTWEARLDGESVATLAELCSALAVVSFDPGSHELISGGAEHRRRFLDWALFHVEPEFLECWRRFSRSLRQRNALLKTQPGGRQLDSWDDELAEAGERLNDLREQQVVRWQPMLLEELANSLGELGPPSLVFVPGWRRNERSFRESLASGRDRDLALGYTVSGPHRADWRIEFEGLPGRDGLSRGQTKLVALAATLSQAGQFAAARAEWPIVALDDLGSELDHEHQGRVLARLADTGAQVLLTGTETPAGLERAGIAADVFHVEQARVTPG